LTDKVDVNDPDFNPYDPENFIATSPMNGRRAVVVDAEAVRWNYGGTREDLVTALKVTVYVPDFSNPFKDLYFTCGGLEPSQDGKTKAIAGPHLVGGGIDRQSNLADFNANLKAAGFPLIELAPSRGKGFFALRGADITWKTIEKSIGKKGSQKLKPYDVPGEFHGFVDLASLNLPDRNAPAEGVEGQAAAPVAVPVTAAPADDTLKATVSEALREAPNGEIQRGQLATKVGPKLAAADRARSFSLLIKDDFLASVAGTTFDKKTIKLS
jgi:hypothetical protein